MIKTIFLWNAQKIYFPEFFLRINRQETQKTKKQKVLLSGRLPTERRSSGSCGFSETYSPTARAPRAHPTRERASTPNSANVWDSAAAKGLHRQKKSAHT